MHKHLLITGGAGFIGSHFAIEAVSRGYKVTILDCLSYASSLDNLASIAGEYQFYQNDINESDIVARILRDHQIDAVVHFAAHTHVDRSIHQPQDFIYNNIQGTAALLQTSLDYYKERSAPFTYLQISTDEVFGSLPLDSAEHFHENTPYHPRSPYAASKAAADHLVNAWHHTYGLPTIVTHAGNNFGPHQHTEKLIPHVVTQALAEKPIPIYGNGKNIRDWLFVKDHVFGVFLALEKGKPGEHYCLGSGDELDNLTLVKRICTILDQHVPRKQESYEALITFVDDRPGHDLRYRMDINKAEKELGFTPKTSFDQALEDTILWYKEQLS